MTVVHKNTVESIPLSQPITNIDDVWLEDDGLRMLGTVVIFGVSHHVEFIRVTGEPGHQIGVGNGGCADVFERLMSYDDDGDFQTFEIPGFEGKWVSVISPYKE